MSTASQSLEHTTIVKLDRIRPSKFNPRKTFDKEGMKDLIASIKEKGILVPLLLRPSKDGLEIVAGERRYRAAQELHLSEVPVIVREMTDEEAREIQIVENLQRSDLHPLEEAEGYRNLLANKEQALTAPEIATKVGKPVSYIMRRMQLLHLSEPIRKMFLANEISTQHAFIAARLTPLQQKEIMPWLKRGDSAVSLRDEIARHFFLILKDAPFDTTDEKLVAKAGSCVNCPKRTGFNKALFEDVQSQDTCTDPNCFDEKVRAFIKVQIGSHKNAVLLTIGDSDNYLRKEAKGAVDWVKAGDKNCPDTKEGVVIERLTHYMRDTQNAKLGAVLKVCTNPKCKTHRSYVSDSGSGYTRSKAEKDSIKKRKVELRRRGLIFKELASDYFSITYKEYRAILDHQIRELSHDDAKAVCDAMEWQPAEAKYGGKDYQGTVAKKLAKLTQDGIYQWSYLLMLAEKELWFYSGSISKVNLLEAKARQANISLATIARLSKAKKAKPKKGADKKKAA
jgi:ParB family transcriptional regulator, chromosome partitioning protein